MAGPKPFASLFLVPALCALPTLAQDTGSRESEAPPGAEAVADEGLEEISDIMVVTASRTEQPLHEAPAAITVLTSEAIARIPADDFGDFLRNVPGVNVSQMSARDIQITTRGATFSLANSNLVLMDNRSLYLDFFGFVMWDYVPLDPNEIKQIEAVNGPGSAVWGANAMSGVINLITKSPKEMQGTSVTFGVGEVGTGYGSVSHAGVSGRLGYKISGAYFTQDAYSRPQGTIPGTEGPTNPGGTPYPEYENKGTSQPKFNLRFDYDQNEATTWVFSGGYAGTDGIMHSGIGPFDIETGANMTFGKADWNRKAMRASLYVNVLDGEARNVLARGIDGQPITFAFNSETYHLEFSDTRVLGGNHVLTYGGNARNNNFDLSIAPRGDKRQELGVFLQDEILFGERLRWIIGARWDDIDPIGSVISPRTTLMYSPTPNHTVRASYNRAFRAPSMINNYLSIVIVNQVNLPVVGPYVFPSAAVGNVELTEERLDAVELGYVGTFADGKTTFTFSAYRSDTTDSIDFSQAATYSSQFQPPGWPLPPILLDVPPPNGFGGVLPAAFSYRNIGEVIDQGIEISLTYRPSRTWETFINYSWQDTPEAAGVETAFLPSGEEVLPINIPPENRVNLGAAYSGNRFFGSALVNYVDEAFWTDVLDSRFWGPTDAYTQLGVTLGVHLAGDRLDLSVIGQNVTDEEVLQHVFGDIISRKVTGQVRFRF